MFKIFVDYPGRADEIAIVRRTTADAAAELGAILNAEEVLALQKLVRRVPVADRMIEYAVDLVQATRIHESTALASIKDYVSWGAGPRACQYLVLGAKAHAVLHGRHHVAMADIRAVAKPVLRHRVLTNFNADAEGITSDVIVERLLEGVSDGGAIEADPQVSEVLQPPSA
jgi:MoxR-like ATPase